MAGDEPAGGSTPPTGPGGEFAHTLPPPPPGATRRLPPLPAASSPRLIPPSSLHPRAGGAPLPVIDEAMAAFMRAQSQGAAELTKKARRVQRDTLTPAVQHEFGLDRPSSVALTPPPAMRRNSSAPMLSREGEDGLPKVVVGICGEEEARQRGGRGCRLGAAGRRCMLELRIGGRSCASPDVARPAPAAPIHTLKQPWTRRRGPSR